MTWTHGEDTMLVSKKQNTCFLCDEPIEAGERHIKRFGWDEKPVSFHMHIDCELRTRDCDFNDWLYHSPIEFRNELREPGTE